MLNVSVFVARNEHRKIWNCLFDEEEFFFFFSQVSVLWHDFLSFSFLWFIWIMVGWELGIEKKKNQIISREEYELLWLIMVLCFLFIIRAKSFLIHIWSKCLNIMEREMYFSIGTIYNIEKNFILFSFQFIRRIVARVWLKIERKL